MRDQYMRTGQFSRTIWTYNDCRTAYVFRGSFALINLGLTWNLNCLKKSSRFPMSMPQKFLFYSSSFGDSGTFYPD